VLQEREFERIGSNQPIAVDVRVLAATNRDLHAAVAAGTFRQDLWYRLHVFPLQIPALRERVDDIPLLVEYLIERYATRAGKKIRTISKQTLALFQAYDWPGNIRELQNVIERAVILCESDTFAVEERWLQREAPPRSGPAVPLVVARAEHERALIEAALDECRGRVSGPAGAAAKLGLPRQTLESKIKALGIDTQRFKNAPRSLTHPAPASRRWETSSTVYAPTTATSDWCVPSPIRPRAQLCRSCVPIIRQLPIIRHPTFRLNTNKSIAYVWSYSCNSSSRQLRWCASSTVVRPPVSEQTRKGDRA